MKRPTAGARFPWNQSEFLSWFRTDADCLDYLDWLRCPRGFVCEPPCCATRGWRLNDGWLMCQACGVRTSVTAGTVFDRSRTPLTVWFAVCWLMVVRKDGVSALGIQREFGMGSYQTAWALLHRLRKVMVRPDRDRLRGVVEVDETFIGGVEPGLAGGRSRGKKVLTCVAVELHEPAGFGRCRMAPIADASGESLRRFVAAHVEPGSKVITDGWQGYSFLRAHGYAHEPRSQRAARARGEDQGDLLLAVHRLAALVKRWLVGTHQGAVESVHLPAYLDEFAFRFHRRHSAQRGSLFFRLLELAVGHLPLRRPELVARPRSISGSSSLTATFGHPRSLDQPSARRPWRNAELADSG